MTTYQHAVYGGVALFVLAVCTIILFYYFQRSKLNGSTTAKIIESVCNTYIDPGRKLRRNRYKCEITYEFTYNDKLYKRTGQIFGLKKYKTGDSIHVTFEQNNPSNSVIKGESLNHLSSTAYLFCAGLMCCTFVGIIGYEIVYNNRNTFNNLTSY
jgi:hypothetical protein